MHAALDQNLHIIHTPGEPQTTCSGLGKPTHCILNWDIENAFEWLWLLWKLCESAWNGPLGSVKLEHNHLDLEESLFWPGPKSTTPLNAWQVLLKVLIYVVYEQHDLHLLVDNWLSDLRTQTNWSLCCAQPWSTVRLLAHLSQDFKCSPMKDKADMMWRAGWWSGRDC